MLVRFTSLIDGLVVRADRMAENVERGLGLHASGRVLLALVTEGGLEPRDGLTTWSSATPLAAADARRPLIELLASDPAVSKALPAASLEACFDDAHLLRNVPAIVARLQAIQSLEEAVR